MSGGRELVIFYSWQSDSPPEHNRQLIRNALRLAFNAIEANPGFQGLHLRLDEATRDEAGSPNIPETIFRKIGQADVYVGDLTTVNPDEQNPRHRTPNKNVLVETGFAGALLGWQRVIMVVNEAHGRAPDDLPFDIRQRRYMSYKSATPPSTSGSSGKGSIKQDTVQLSKQLETALISLIQIDPARPVRVVADPDAMKRERDILIIAEMLEYLNTDILDELLEGAPYRIPTRGLYFADCYHAFRSATTTHFHDEDLERLTRDIDKHWCTLLAPEHYSPGPGDHYLIWSLRRGGVDDASADRAYKAAEKTCRLLDGSYKALIAHIRQHYVEVDTKAELAMSWSKWKRRQQEIADSSDG